MLAHSLTGRAQTLTIYQAETGQLVAANVGTGAAGYTGTGFVENMTTQGSSALTFTVTVPTAGAYDLDTRYAAGRRGPSSAETMSVYINGAWQARAFFPGSDAWSNWSTQTTTVVLAAGTNTIRYFYDWSESGWVNLDYLLVRAASHEAATAQLSAANAGTGAVGYTGTGYAENITQAGASTVTFLVNAPAAGTYSLTTRYAAARGDERTMSVYVNGTDFTGRPESMSLHYCHCARNRLQRASTL